MIMEIAYFIIGLFFASYVMFKFIKTFGLPEHCDIIDAMFLGFIFIFSAAFWLVILMGLFFLFIAKRNGYGN